MVNARLWPTDSEVIEETHQGITSIYYVEDSGHFPMLEQLQQFKHNVDESG
ncbi:hypothetical protein O9992_17225 [Vibrio lentus]|nr:hypothetical protein [Vibrio lentus]